MRFHIRAFRNQVPGTTLARSVAWQTKLAIAAGVLSAAGCATKLDAVRVKDWKTAPLTGAPYNLTFTQYEITVSRRLKACPAEAKTENGKVVVPEQLNLVVAIETGAPGKEVRDPMREYVIDFSGLRAFMKTSDVSVEYHDNGALKSVNATVTDETGQFLTSIFSSAAKLAGAGATGTLSLPTDPKPSGKCRPEIVTALADAERLVADSTKMTADLNLVTADLERLTAMGAAMGRAWGTRERTELKDQINLMFTTRKALAKVNEDLKAVLKKITVVDKEIWPPNGETFGAPPDGKRAAALVPPLTDEQINKWGDPSAANRGALKKDTSVWVRLEPTSTIGRKAACPGNVCPDDGVEGLKYRMPAPGRLLTCSNEECTEAAVLAENAGLISQLGPVFTLPLKNYPFMKQTIVATFNEAGQPTKLGFVSDAVAPKVGQAFGSLVDQTLAVREARKPKSELDKLKAETDFLKAQAELAAAKKALEPPKSAAQTEAAAAFTADAAVLQAELAFLQAEAALAAAKTQAAKP